MNQIELKASDRAVLGKKVRFLRRQGIMPVHLFGHNVDSQALQTDSSSLQNVLAQAGKTRLINLTLEKDPKPRKVVVREIQKEPITGKLLHVDLYQVSMEEKITMEIPIVLVGESPALKAKDTILTQDLNSLDIECLPDAIPSRIEVDISRLTEAEQEIRVKDIQLGPGITILNNPEVVVVGTRMVAAEKVKAPEAEAAVPEVIGVKPAEEAKEA